MNEIIRDNRIFPEEMHQHPEAPKEFKTPKYFWTFISILLVALATWFVYTEIQKKRPFVDPDILSPEEQKHIDQKQTAHYEAIKKTRPVLTPEERKRRIREIFSNQ